MRLKKAQINELLKWVAEGLTTPEINERAAKSEDPFRVSRSQVDYYRHTRKVNIWEIAQSQQTEALASGLALKAERVRRLQLLAALMEEDIFYGALWLDQVKMIGSGFDQERVEYEEFNTAEIAQYRGILDDIAKEVGDRKQINEVDLNKRVTFVWDIPVPQKQQKNTD